MIERPAYYVLPYNDSTGTGAEFNVEIKLDPDAPFRLNSIVLWPLGGSANTASAFPSSVQLRYTRPDRMWVQRHMIAGNTLSAGDARVLSFGINSNLILASPVSPNMVYPPSGTVIFDIQTQPNIGAVAMLVILIGTKIFRDGAVWSPTYPAKYRARPFFGYGVQVAGPALPVLNLPMPIAPDADFVWQTSTYSDNGGASASTSFGGEAVSGLTFTAVTPGGAGNTITVNLLQAGLNTPLSITVIGNAITVNLATTGLGGVLSTGQDVVDIVNATPAATALVTITGTGLTLPSPIASGGVPVNLSGGSDSTPNMLYDLGVRFKDYDGKYYMNDFIPVGILYGFGLAQLPGLPYPEIYVPKNQALYFDFQWLTLSAVPTSPGVTTATLSHKGMKVYS